MANVAIKNKYIGLILALILVLIIFRFIYVNLYVSAYREIQLIEINDYKSEEIYVENPYWQALYDEESINLLNKKYGTDINIDLKKYMLIVSYGAELEKLDYNKLEATYRDRGSYIGFPNYGDIQKNTVFFYQADYVPIMNTDVAGYAPEYNGKYRN